MSAPVQERRVLEELCNVVEHYPLWPGGTISSATALELSHRRWIARDSTHYWIPTREGIAAHDRLTRWEAP